MDLYSDHVAKIPLKRTYERLRKIDKFLVAFFGLTLISIGTSLVWFIRDMVVLKKPFIYGRLDWKQIDLWQVLIVFLISLGSIIIHEFGHLFMAAHYRVKFDSLNIRLKFGVMPAFYVKYENIYETAIKKRVRILAGGIYMNLFIAVLFWIIYSITENRVFIIIYLLNLYDVVGNLSPLSNSDGYYMFSVLLGLEGFRWKIVRNLSSFLRGEKNWRSFFEKDNTIYVLYFIISFIIMLLSLEKLIVETFAFLSIEVSGEGIIFFILICMVLRIVVSFRSAIKKIKQIN